MMIVFHPLMTTGRGGARPWLGTTEVYNPVNTFAQHHQMQFTTSYDAKH